MSLNVIIVKLLNSKKQFLKNLCSGTQCGGFKFLLILDLWGISFHVVVVFDLGNDLLFKSVLEHCVIAQKERILTGCIYLGSKKSCNASHVDVQFILTVGFEFCKIE